MSKKRKAGYKKVKVSKNISEPEETPERLRKDFPKKLIDIFVEVVKANWSEPQYEKFNDQVKRFIGKNKAEDALERGQLIVQLNKACDDLTEPYRKQRREADRMRCEKHPKYKGLRRPKSECKRCLKIYNEKKAKKEKETKDKKLVGRRGVDEKNPQVQKQKKRTIKEISQKES